jgi:putative transposase
MERKRSSEEQIIGILEKSEAGAAVLDLCRRHGIWSATFYACKGKCGELEVSEAKQLQALEDESDRLKRLVAEAMLDNAGLKDLLSKTCEARPPSGRRSRISGPRSA